MSGMTDLTQLLNQMEPTLAEQEYVFCVVQGPLSHYLELNPIATFVESEGLTLVLTKQTAQQEKLAFEGVFKKVTLTVHSSLAAVGLTAAVSTKLTEHQISANVIAAFYHDHVFVPAEKAHQAMTALTELSTLN